MQVRTFNPLRQQTRKFSTELKASRILLANVLQKILHKVLLITKVKIFRHRSTINFSEDYFRQQYLR